MTIKINVAPQTKQEDDGVECKCTRDSWPLILLMTGFGVAFLVVLVNVLSLMNFEGVPSVVLSVYMIAMAMLGLEAEFRRFKFLRSIIYNFFMKYFYFLTNYYVRGVYYIFLGTLLLNNKPLNIIAGGVCIGLGVLLCVVHFTVGLPIYPDWQEEQAETEARIRRDEERKAQGQEGFRSGSTPGAHDHTQTAQQQAQAPAAANPAYQPAEVPAPGRNQYEPSLPAEEREPEVPSARRMNNDDDLARRYYAQQAQPPYSPSDNTYAQPQHQQPRPQVYGVSGSPAGPASGRNLDNPFDAADEYQPSRF